MKRRIHKMAIEEVSIVDKAANLAKVEIVKNLGSDAGPASDDGVDAKKAEASKMGDEGEDAQKAVDGAGPPADVTSSETPLHDGLVQEKVAAIASAAAKLTTAAADLSFEDAWDAIYKMEDLVWSLREFVPVIAEKAVELHENVKTKKDLGVTLDTMHGVLVKLAQHNAVTKAAGGNVGDKKSEGKVADQVATEKSLADQIQDSGARKALAAQLADAGYSEEAASKALDTLADSKVETVALKALKDENSAVKAENEALKESVADVLKRLKALEDAPAASQQAATDSGVKVDARKNVWGGSVLSPRPKIQIEEGK